MEIQTEPRNMPNFLCISTARIAPDSTIPQDIDRLTARLIRLMWFLMPGLIRGLRPSTLVDTFRDIFVKYVFRTLTFPAMVCCFLNNGHMQKYIFRALGDYC